MCEKLYKGQWTKEKANAWNKTHAWVRGFNYLPSNATRLFEMWQEYGFEERLNVMDKEIALAKSVGFNSVRMIMNFETWRDNPTAYKERMERVLCLLDKYGFTMTAVFGNDCTVPKEEYAPPVFGKIIPDMGYHGGVKKSPHRAGLTEGYLPIDEEDLAPLYYEWVRDIISAHKDDKRIMIWNLWNEVGNTKRFNKSEKHLRKYFEIAREIGCIQPLTADCWMTTFSKDVLNPLENLREIEYIALELSDVISFHHYGKYANVVSTIKTLKEKYGRPMFNTEWLHRPFENRVEELFPLFYLENVGCYHWGLVAGNAQYYEPWDSIRGSNLNIDLWQHDIFRANHRPYSHKEIELFKTFCDLADKDFAENDNK